MWRNLAAALAHAATQAAKGLGKKAAQAVREPVRAEWVALIHVVLDASTYLQAEQELAQLMLTTSA